MLDLTLNREEGWPIHTVSRLFSELDLQDEHSRCFWPFYKDRTCCSGACLAPFNLDGAARAGEAHSNKAAKETSKIFIVVIYCFWKIESMGVFGNFVSLVEIMRRCVHQSILARSTLITPRE